MGRHRGALRRVSGRGAQRTLARLRQIDGKIGNNAPRPRRHDGDAGRQVNRLEDAVRDKDDGRAAAFPKPQQIVVQRHPGNLVECGEGFVEQQQIGVGHERAGDRDAHPHAARQLARISLLEPGETDRAQFGHGALALGRPNPAIEAKRQYNIPEHR